MNTNNEETKDARIVTLKSLLRQALSELEYFKFKNGEFKPLLMSAIKHELEKE